MKFTERVRNFVYAVNNTADRLNDPIMKIIGSIRNFFYAVTHANQLITENAELKSLYTQTCATAEELYGENQSLRRENEALMQEKQARMIPLDRVCELIEPSQKIEGAKVPFPPNMPVGRINYLGTNGAVGESIEHYDEAEFIDKIKQKNYYGVPMSITVYSDPATGKHIDTSWVKDMDPPPQGFSITPWQEQPEQEVPEQAAPEVDEPTWDYEP